jgi:hypothetical protein
VIPNLLGYTPIKRRKTDRPELRVVFFKFKSCREATIRWRVNPNNATPYFFSRMGIDQSDLLPGRHPEGRLQQTAVGINYLRECPRRSANAFGNLRSDKDGDLKQNALTPSPVLGIRFVHGSGSWRFTL